MLIVVAIIAILVAVSIPLVGNSLDKAEAAADDANKRAAKAVAMLVYMEQVKEETDGVKKSDLASGVFYDAANGKLKKEKTGIKGYGQASTNKGYVLKVTMTTDGAYSEGWEAAAGS